MRSPLFRIALTLLLVTMIATTLSACGRKGRPVAPDGATYDRPYPTS